MVPMKRSLVASLWILFLCAALSLRSQVLPSAATSALSIDGGALGTVFQPDYAGEGIAQTGPKRLWGVGAYVDARFSRWVQVEGEGRWLRFNEYLGIDQDTYLIGPRVPIYEFRRFTPYAKALVGMGGGSFLNGQSFVVAYGGGLDFRLSRRLTVRGEYEYQQWRITPTLYPYGVSAGISYKIFGPPSR